MEKSRRVLWRRPDLVLSALFALSPAFACAPLWAGAPVLDGFSINGADAPSFNGLTTLLLTKDGQAETLEGWPDRMLVWKDEILFLEKKGEETQKLGDIPLSNAFWWPSVSYADIDFDGEPDFFLLDQEAMTGSLYRLVSSNGVFPAARFKAPPLLIADEDLLFKAGISPEPAFSPETRFLEFYSREGPYNTIERWRWNGSSYFLAERQNAIYSPEIANEPMAFMERRTFDERGHQIGQATYHPEQAKDFAPLRYQVLLPIPLYLSPSFKATSAGTLKPGASFEVVAYDIISSDNDDGILISDDLYNPLMEDYLKQPAVIIAAAEVADGIDLSARKGDDPPFVIRLGEPLAIPYKRRP